MGTTTESGPIRPDEDNLTSEDTFTGTFVISEVKSRKDELSKDDEIK